MLICLRWIQDLEKERVVTNGALHTPSVLLHIGADRTQCRSSSWGLYLKSANQIIPPFSWLSSLSLCTQQHLSSLSLPSCFLLMTLGTGRRDLPIATAVPAAPAPFQLEWQWVAVQEAMRQWWEVSPFLYLLLACGENSNGLSREGEPAHCCHCHYPWLSIQPLPSALVGAGQEHSGVPPAPRSTGYSSRGGWVFLSCP